MENVGGGFGASIYGANEIGFVGLIGGEKEIESGGRSCGVDTGEIEGGEGGFLVFGGGECGLVSLRLAEKGNVNSARLEGVYLDNGVFVFEF